MKSFFQRKRLHKYTCSSDSLVQPSLIHLCMLSRDLFRLVLYVVSKEGAELSNNHHLVF